MALRALRLRDEMGLVFDLYGDAEIRLGQA